MIHESTSVQHAFSISLFEDRVYWSDWQNRTVAYISKIINSTANEISVSEERLPHRPMDLKVIHPALQPKIGKSLLGEEGIQGIRMHARHLNE